MKYRLKRQEIGTDIVVHGRNMIKTERLSIRRIQAEDWKGIQAIWADAEKSVYAQYDAPNDPSEASVRRRVKRWASVSDSMEHIFYGVFLQDDLIGYVGLHDIGPSYEIGYCFRSDQHRKGYAKESIRAILEHLSSKGIRSFSAGTALNNTPSVNLLRSLGFEQTGTELVSFYKDEKGRDIWFKGGIYELKLEEMDD